VHRQVVLADVGATGTAGFLHVGNLCGLACVRTSPCVWPSSSAWSVLLSWRCRGRANESRWR
jgi:hypothetical protein